MIAINLLPVDIRGARGMSERIGRPHMLDFRAKKVERDALEAMRRTLSRERGRRLSTCDAARECFGIACDNDHEAPRIKVELRRWHSPTRKFGGDRSEASMRVMVPVSRRELDTLRRWSALMDLSISDLFRSSVYLATQA